MLQKSSKYRSVHAYRGATPTNLPACGQTIVSSLVRHSRRRPNAAYLTIVGSEEPPVTVSYLEMDDLSSRVAHGLRYELECEPGAAVGLIAGTDVFTVAMILGALKAGCSLALLNHAEPATRISAQLDKLGIRVVFRSQLVPAIKLPVTIDASEFCRTGCRGSRYAEPCPTLSLPALFFGTSGSTAASKIVAQSHYNVVENAKAVCHHHQLTNTDRLLGCLPLHHVNGVHFTLFATLMAGAHVILLTNSDPVEQLRQIRHNRPRLVSLVPSILESMLEVATPEMLPPELQYFVSAAAPLAPRTVRDVTRRMGRRILQGYGLTETTNFSTTVPNDISFNAYRRVMCESDAPSIGVALYGNDIAVMAEDGNPARIGDTGELCIRGHNVMMGYAGNAEETAKAFRDGWFHSQDLGYETSDGESGMKYFVITGRTKNIAKVGGESVSLEEVERALLNWPEIQDAACISIPHRLLGEAIVAAVVSTDVSTLAIRRHLLMLVSPMALPRHFVRLERIPRTATGKICRSDLTQVVMAKMPELLQDRTQ